MSPPCNGIFVVRGEMSIITTAMRRGSRWNSNSYQNDEQDVLIKSFSDLKEVLQQVEDLRLVEPNIFLAPFLEVIRSEDTTGPVTSLALSAVNKFLSYGLIDPTHSTLASTVEQIADAVTHARFVGTDQTSDGVVLMKIVQVLRTLVLSPEGSALTDESICDIILACFRLCFEPRLNELVRRTAEHALKDIVLLLFMRLPQFAEGGHSMKALKIRSSANEQSIKKRKISKSGSIEEKKANLAIPKIVTDESSPTTATKDEEEPTSPNPSTMNKLKPLPLSTTPATPAGVIVDMQGSISQTPKSALEKPIKEEEPIQPVEPIETGVEVKDEKNDCTGEIDDDKDGSASVNEDYVNAMGVRFTPQSSDDSSAHLPYGLPCIRELFRFLISLCNPLDKQNTDVMTHMGLSLLTVSFEVAADSIGNYPSLLLIVKDDLCRNLFALLNSERISIFAADLQLCFLLFESLRSQLKFQMEYYLTKLADLIVNENPKILYEARELALDNLLQFWRIQGFAAELYINYDCDLYCTNLFEDLTKLLSKNTLSATHSIYSVHTLSTDALLTIIESIERNCVSTKTGNAPSYMRHSRNNSSVERIVLERQETIDSEPDNVVVESINKFIKSSQNEERLTRILGADISATVTHDQLMQIKRKKRLLTQGTDLFNQRPEKGIQFLQENGILNPVLDPMEIAHFLRENSGLDKKMIGEFISKKKNVESKILETFVKSFDFAGLRVDQALRLYLETFRLPGEAPLIFLVMEHFAEHWHSCNNEPFANTDAAFRLAYSIIMLNMDQHNHNAKRLNVPMTVDDFQKNLRGLNGNLDFDQEMLLEIFNSIKNEEIIMPAEQTGLVRENYLWKVLLRRGTTKDGVFHHVFGAHHDKELFEIIWGPALAALSFVFDKSGENVQLYQKAITGFIKSAAISSYYNLYADFDALTLTLCKFTTLLNPPVEVHEITTNVLFGQNIKAQLAMKTVYTLVHDHGDSMREAWKHIIDVILQLFKLKLLPKLFMEAEDFCDPTGKIQLSRDQTPIPRTDSGILSSLYSYLSSDSQRQPSYEEQEIIKVSKRCIKDCQIDQIVNESKFLQFESLEELIKCILTMIKPPESHRSVGLPYAENTVVFLLELLVKILIQNRDRLLPIWPICRDQLQALLTGAAVCEYEYLLQRTTIALLKLAIYLMRNEEICSTILQSLKMLLSLKPAVILSISKQISIGMFELLKTSAQNIHTEADWAIVFTILECVGAGAIPPEYEDMHSICGTKSDGALSSEEDSGLPDRGYISDSEVIKSNQSSNVCTPLVSPTGDNWILVNKDADIVSSRSPSPKHSIMYPCKLLEHSPFALVKCWDSLSFIVRNVAHITPYNFESCVKCIRTFVEASMNGGKGKKKHLKPHKRHHNKNYAKNDGGSDSEGEELPERYQTISIQLLDLMHTLLTRTAQIFRWWAEEGGSLPQCSALWSQGWCPLLQGIARLATDIRRQVRTSALACLQRSLLVPDLQSLTGPEWAGCFKQVLFPLLSELLSEKIGKHIDAGFLEESNRIISKVFLHHLSPLISLPNFSEIWLEILDYLEKFIKLGSDMLYEAVRESLKNMLLVMNSVGVFKNHSGENGVNLWDITWQRISAFLPNLKEELILPEHEMRPVPISVAPLPPVVQPQVIQNVEPINESPVHTNLVLQPKSSPTNNILLQQQVPILMPQSPHLVQDVTPIHENLVQLQTLETTVDSVEAIVEEDLDQNDEEVNKIQQEAEECELSVIVDKYSNIIELPMTPTPPPQPQEEIVCHPESEEPPPPVPISHLIAGNQYPSLNKVPIGIAQSFAPVFIQPNAAMPTDNADIYNDYINNPYNLTLQMNSAQSLEQGASGNNIFQSSNYFSSGSGKQIPPPGSEMLFGEP